MGVGALFSRLGDDAHDLFTKTFNAAFVQITTSRDRREAAAKVLGHFPRFSALATSVKLDAFERVKQAIDDMVAELAKVGRYPSPLAGVRWNFTRGRREAGAYFGECRELDYA